MKNAAFLTVAALAAAAAVSGAASAQTFNTGDFARAALEKIAPAADVAELTNAQAVAVYQAVQDENTAANRAASAEAMINSYQ
jgi:Skp family chaperone for outer membrane proteins